MRIFDFHCTTGAAFIKKKKNINKTYSVSRSCRGVPQKQPLSSPLCAKRAPLRLRVDGHCCPVLLHVSRLNASPKNCAPHNVRTDNPLFLHTHTHANTSSDSPPQQPRPLLPPSVLRPHTLLSSDELIGVGQREHLIKSPRGRTQWHALPCSLYAHTLAHTCAHASLILNVTVTDCTRK